MGTDIRNRKNKSKNGKEKICDNYSKDDIKSWDRDSGDGASTPGTPPSEFNSCVDKSSLSSSENVSQLSKNNKKKIISKLSHEKPVSTSISSGSTSNQSISVPLKFEIDGMSIAIFVLALATRLWKLDSPNAVVFDELHYGKYASLYMQNTFFFDSQPPLGKQLIAAGAYAAGYNGSFKFERIGTPYDESVPLVALRLVPAIFGSLLMPATYSLVIEVGASQCAGLLAVFLMIFDNAVLAQSRFMLMEPILMFFGICGLVFILRMRRFYYHPYSLAWFGCLIAGITCLSAAFCVKYFGLFTFAFGLYILTRDYWVLVADRTISGLQLLFHLIIRAIFVISIPIGIYLSVFYVHLNLLYKAGPNDNIMTSAFQASLEGGLSAIISNQPVQIVHGSQITLRHTHGKTCWLHSHDEVYPVKYADDRGSSHQQQVTCYSYKDVNNWWIVKKPENDDMVVREPHEPIKDGDIVQLVHGLTSRTLSSHDVASAMSPYSQEVACYIDYNVSMPAQNLWKIEILNKEATGGLWLAVQSLIRLVHVNTSTVLRFSGKQLPDWGFRQHEIVADKTFDHDDAIFNVEEHRYSNVEDEKERERELMTQEMIPTERRNMSFSEKLYELQYKMIFNNQENVAGHMYASDPLDWLTLKRGVAYWVSSASNAQIHFLGNIVVWLSGTASLLVFAALFILYFLRRERECYDIQLNEWNKFCNVGEVFMIGYLVHYLPYFLVDRTLFLHHYIPAYIFKICLLSCLINHGYYLTSKWLKSRILSWIYLALVALWMALVLFVFVEFSPFTYGDVALSSQRIRSLTWRDTWDFLIIKE